MPPKVTPISVIISRLQNMQHTNIKDANSNANNMWFKETLQQLIINQRPSKSDFALVRGDGYKPGSLKF